MAKVSVNKILGLVFRDQLKTILYFPIWWYSKGLLKVFDGGLAFISDMEQTLGFSIWVKNLFTPIFGQRDLAGRLISFFLRLFEIIFRGIALIIIIILVIIVLIIWLVLPIFIISQLIIHI